MGENKLQDLATFLGQQETKLNEIKNKSKDVDEFTELCRPLIKYLCDNHHPHVTIIITSTTAELLEGKMSAGQIFDYVKD